MLVLKHVEEEKDPEDESKSSRHPTEEKNVLDALRKWKVVTTSPAQVGSYDLI